jgi:hypothetical protein
MRASSSSMSLRGSSRNNNRNNNNNNTHKRYSPNCDADGDVVDDDDDTAAIRFMHGSGHDQAIHHLDNTRLGRLKMRGGNGGGEAEGGHDGGDGDLFSYRNIDANDHDMGCRYSGGDGGGNGEAHASRGTGTGTGTGMGRSTAAMAKLQQQRWQEERNTQRANMLMLVKEAAESKQASKALAHQVMME